MKKAVSIRYLLFLVLLALMACSPKAPKEDAVAKVNDGVITAQDLLQELERYGKINQVTRHTIDDRLQVMIEQKLLIQEAIKMGLPEDKKFVETIKTYWEQTIIRNLIEAKTAELSKTIFVSDNEIAHEYERMKFRPRIRAVRGVHTEAKASEIIKQMKNGEHIEGETIIGPIFYDDVKGTPLARAFDMTVGQVEAFNTGDERIVIGVIDREAFQLPPLQELAKRIRESILDQKRRKALAEWIAAVKKVASVKIDEKELRRISHE
jgi:hypothetical protein